MLKKKNQNSKHEVSSTFPVSCVKTVVWNILQTEILLFKNIYYCLFRELISTQAAMEGMQSFRIFIV